MSAKKVYVTVFFAHSLKQIIEEITGLKDRLSKYLANLISDLGITAEAYLNIIYEENEGNLNRSIDDQYYIIICDKKCRPTLPTMIPQKFNILDIIRSVCRTIFQNRVLFLTPSVVEEVYQIGLANAQTCSNSCSQRKFHELLFEFVHRGYSIERSKFVLRDNKLENNSNPWELFEEAISGFDTLTLNVYVNSVYYSEIAKDTDSGRTEIQLSKSLMEESIDSLQKDFFEELGIVIPKISFSRDDSLESNEFYLQINDLRLPVIKGLDMKTFMVNATAYQLSSLVLSGINIINPADLNENIILEDNDSALETCKGLGVTAWQWREYIILALGSEIRRNAGSLINSSVIKRHIDRLAEVFPSMTEAVLSRYHVTQLTQILRSLLDDRISIKDLRTILENLLSINNTVIIRGKGHTLYPSTNNLCPVANNLQNNEIDPLDYADHLRISMKQYISYNYSIDSSPSSFFCLLDPSFESIIRNIEEQSLTEPEYESISQLLMNAFLKITSNPSRLVILTTLEIKKKLRKITAREFPNIKILSFDELPLDMKVRSIIKIGSSS